MRGESAGPSSREEYRSAHRRTARRWIVRSFTIFIGLKAATTLILVFLAASVAGSIMPIESFDVFHSWWYHALLVLFAAQVALCTVGRFRTAWVQFADPGSFRPDGGESVMVSETPLAVVVQRARELGFREAAAEGDRIVLSKGRLQPLGFIILHVSLLVLLLGLAWNLSVGFVGYLYLPVGQRVLDPETNRTFEIRSVEPEFREVRRLGSEPTVELRDMRAQVAVFEGASLVAEGELSLGSAFPFDRGEVVLLPSLDRFQVVLEVRSPSGRVTVERLASDAPAVSLPGRDDLLASVTDFLPDAVSENGVWRSGGSALAHPLVSLQIVHRFGDGGDRVVVDGDLQLGQSVQADGYTVRFLDAVYMPGGVVSARSGATLVWLGIVANVVGVVLSLAFSFRHLVLRRTAEGVEVRGYARRRNQPLDEELSVLAGIDSEAPGGDLVVCLGRYPESDSDPERSQR